MNKNRVFSAIIFIIFILLLNFDVFSFIDNIKQQLGGYFYPLDDTYIHLAIAKNIANDCVWGITKYQFSSTSSSPIFTLMLAGIIKLFGNNQLIPLYLNIALGNLLVLVIYVNFNKKPLQLLFLFSGFFIGVLIKVQIITGMEHVLQLLIITTSWIYFYKWYLSDFENNKYKIYFYITVPLLCLTRYESLFFITPIILFLLVFKKFKIGLIVSFLAYVPVFIFGFYSIKEGGHFFPNSLLIKGKHSFSLVELFRNFNQARFLIVQKFSFYLYLFTILLVFLFAKYAYVREAIFDSLKIIIRENLIFLIVVVTIFGHLMFASTGWLYRYDAYLIALLIISIAFASERMVYDINYSVLISSAFFFVISVGEFTSRYWEANSTLKFASKNIHDQQIQMAKFVQKYFNKSTIVANDIGAISYFSDIKIQDLVGLGSTDLLNVKQFHPGEFNKYVNKLDFDLMIIYDSWFKDLKMDNRIKVAELILKNNRICGDSIVSFYLPKNLKNSEYTQRSLESFSKELPDDIKLNLIH